MVLIGEDGETGGSSSHVRTCGLGRIKVDGQITARRRPALDLGDHRHEALVKRPNRITKPPWLCELPGLVDQGIKGATVAGCNGPVVVKNLIKVGAHVLRLTRARTGMPVIWGTSTLVINS